MKTRFILPVFSAVLALTLPGCGGAALGSLPQSLGGDLAPGYNTPLPAGGGSRSDRLLGINGCYPMIQTSFKLASVPGNPFDYQQVNVKVAFQKPGGGTVNVDAFYNGSNQWMARYTPLLAGEYTVRGVTLNGTAAHDTNLKPTSFNVKGPAQPGFIRIDTANPHRFAFDNGTLYYPLGQDVAWGSSNLPTIPQLFAAMHQHDENWARVWMNYWDGKSLMWGVKPGTLNLKAAQQWDTIVQAAGQNNIYFQMVLQHHGEYSSNVNPNWPDNPYNIKNGGFLHSPAGFFTNPKAISLTKQLLHYVLARWGYSPNIMAFELFNEVQYTNAMQQHEVAAVAEWHQVMASFLKSHDINRHLITTSSAPDVPLSSPIWNAVDYLQLHIYPQDIIAALSGRSANGALQLHKPMFVGEFGSNGPDPDGIALHNGLWAGIFTYPSGAPCYWAWDNIQQHDLYPQFQSAAEFLTQSGLAEQMHLKNSRPAVQTKELSTMQFSPGGSFASTKLSRFEVTPQGVQGMASYPAYLQGTAHRSMMPSPVELVVHCPRSSRFMVHLSQISAAGASLQLSVDGAVSGSEYAIQNYAAQSANYKPDNGMLEVQVPFGRHVITLQNTGADWAVVSSFAITHYAPALSAISRTGKTFAAGWVWQPAAAEAPLSDTAVPTAGKLLLTGLKPGKYRLLWWNTWQGKTVQQSEEEVPAGGSITLQTPPVSRDLAFALTSQKLPLHTQKVPYKRSPKSPSPGRI